MAENVSPKGPSNRVPEKHGLANAIRHPLKTFKGLVDKVLGKGEDQGEKTETPTPPEVKTVKEGVIKDVEKLGDPSQAEVSLDQVFTDENIKVIQRAREGLPPEMQEVEEEVRNRVMEIGVPPQAEGNEEDAGRPQTRRSSLQLDLRGETLQEDEDLLGLLSLSDSLLEFSDLRIKKNEKGEYRVLSDLKAEVGNMSEELLAELKKRVKLTFSPAVEGEPSRAEIRIKAEDLNRALDEGKLKLSVKQEGEELYGTLEVVK